MIQLLGLLFLLCSCTGQSSISARYLTAEKLWTEKKYEASVVEFDRIVKDNPGSALGLQSLWRASMTRALFLDNPSDAIRGLQSFIEQSAQNNLKLEAQKQLGEIYFGKTGQYDQAIEHYQKLITSKKFSTEDEGFFLYRISRAYSALGKIKKAITTQEQILVQFPKGDLAIKTKLDLAQNWFTLGEVDKTAYNKSLNYFKQVSDETKTTSLKIFRQAQFGMATVLEELDRFDEAIKLFESIEAEYEVPNVVRIRINKINDRTQRKKI